MKKAKITIAAIAIALAGLSAMPSCNKKDDTAPAKPTLYDSLGGTTMVADPSNPSVMIEKGRLGLRSVVDSTIFVIAADTSLNKFFTVLLAEVTASNLTGFEALSKSLTDFFCVATGAKNFTYSGKNMVASHDPAQNPRMNGKSSAADFDRFVTDLVIGAKKCGLSDQLIGQVGYVVSTVKTQVVQK